MEIAIISGKGGTGKSSISAAFATLNKKVVIADCDVDAANLYLLFNPQQENEETFISGHKAVINYSQCTNCRVCKDYCRFDAITIIDGIVTISDISCDGCFLCTHICPEDAISMVQNDKSRLYSGNFRNGKIVYGRLAPGDENSGKLVNMVREKAKDFLKTGDFKHIILDGPPGIGCPVISTITGADKVLIVTEPTISGLSDMKRAINIAQSFNISPEVIINKSDLNTIMTKKINRWCEKNHVPVAGTLPFDTDVVEAMVQGKSITEYDSDNKISKKLEEIWHSIVDIN
jgi:MinD superfamily P-loop ATPase